MINNHAKRICVGCFHLTSEMSFFKILNIFLNLLIFNSLKFQEKIIYFEVMSICPKRSSLKCVHELNGHVDEAFLGLCQKIKDQETTGIEV